MAINKTEMKKKVSLSRGSLYIPKQIYELYFAGLDSIILLARDDHFLVMPVHNVSSGGYLLKLRNRFGDRLITAPDFFYEIGLLDDTALEFDVAWDQEMAALKVKNSKN